MTLLHQILAVEDSAKSAGERGLTSAYHAIQKEQLFSGIERKYEPIDDDGDQLPPESTKVQQNVEQLLTLVSGSMTRLLDVTLTKDTANTEATIDLEVDGLVLASEVPVTFLLTLEKQLVGLRTFASKLPVLDPAEDWSHDSTTGVFANRPSKTTRSKKVPRAFVKYPATDKHPAQVDTLQEDIIVGYWTTKKFSGRISQERQTEILERIDKLTRAVKRARAKANAIEVQEQRIGGALFGYLFGA